MSHPLIAISRKQALLFSSFLVLYQFLTYIANDMIMPGMIHVVASFHGKESAIATSLTAYVFGGASLQIFLGPLSDAIGRRPVMLAGSLLFFIFTLLIAFSNSMTQFLIARYFEGMGLCFIAVIGYATLQEIFSEMDAIRLIAILTNISLLAPLLGPLAGATFILYFNWRAIFIVIGTLALIAVYGLWRYMPEPVGATKKDGQTIPRVPLTPKNVLRNYKHLLTNPAFIIGAISAGLLCVPCIAWIAISPIIIVTEAKLTVVDYALWQLPIFGAGILGNWYLRRLTHQHTVKTIIMRGSIIASIGLLLSFALPVCLSGGFEWLMPGLTLYGFGIGIATAPLIRHVLYSTPVSKGTTYAMLSMISMCLQAIGVEVANTMYATHNTAYFGLYCSIIAIMYLIGVSSLFVLSRTSTEDNHLSVPVL